MHNTFIIKNQIRHMFRRSNFWIGFYIMLFFSLYCYILNVNESKLLDVSGMTTASFHYIGNGYNSSVYNNLRLLFPFVIVFPFAFANFEEKFMRTDNYILSRVNKKSYYRANLLTAFLGSFLIILIPFLINIALNQLTLPENGYTPFGTTYEKVFWLNMLFDYDVFLGHTRIAPAILYFDLYLFSPVLHSIVMAVHFAVFSGILGSFAYAVSFSVKKYKILILLPVYLLFLITTNLTYRLYQFDLFDYLFISRQDKNMTVFYLLSAGMLLFAVLRVRSQIRKDTV